MNQVKKVLEDQECSQRWLANRLGKSFNTATDYVQNRQQTWLEVLNEIANYIGVVNRVLLFGHKT